MESSSDDELLKKLYQEMADLTRPFCGKCPVPVSCCAPEFCEMTKLIASQEWGVELKNTDHPTLPLMGPNGCTAAPHLRPQCTYHTCSMNGLGVLREGAYGPVDKKATQRYFQLRGQIDVLEAKRAEQRSDRDRKALDLEGSQDQG